MNRTNKLFKNSVVGILSFVVSTIMSFIVQRIFVSKLGYENSGLSAVLSTIITTLSIAELGIGTAIVFSLFKPIAENNERKIAILISVYRKIFLVIGLIVAVVGLAILPLLPILTKHQFEFSYIAPIYLIYLLNSFLSYLFTYNHTLLSADQKQYAVSIVTSLTKIVVGGMQIAVLYLTSNFLLFVSVNVIITLLANCLLTFYVKKKYKFLKEYSGKLDKEDSKQIKTNVVSLVYHRIGNYLVNGTDSLIISGILGVIFAGFYSNYLVLVNSLIFLFCNIFSGATAAFGNIIATEDKSVIKRAFERLKFSNFFLAVIATTGVFMLSKDILTIWLSSETVLPMSFVIFLSINFFITCYSRPLGDLRAAAGIFRPDRYVHILIAVLNLVLSLILVQFWGITGVLVGTTVSLLIKECIVLPVIGSKYIYGGKPAEYYIRFIIELAITFAIVALCYWIYSLVIIPNIILRLLIGFVICVGLPICILVPIYFKTDEFKYFINLIKRMFFSIFKRKKIAEEKTEQNNVTLNGNENIKNINSDKEELNQNIVKIEEK